MHWTVLYLAVQVTRVVNKKLVSIPPPIYGRSTFSASQLVKEYDLLIRGALIGSLSGTEGKLIFRRGSNLHF